MKRPADIDSLGGIAKSLNETRKARRKQLHLNFDRTDIYPEFRDPVLRDFRHLLSDSSVFVESMKQSIPYGHTRMPALQALP